MNPNIHVWRNIPFTSAGQEILTADVYLPAAGTGHPAVLLIHGGAWKAGSKEMYSDWGVFLAENGYVAVSINYRLSAPGRPTWPGVMDDVREALSWMVSRASEWKMNPDRIGIIGDSCGAQLAVLLALEQPCGVDRIRTVVGVYGVYDVTKWWEYTQRSRDDDPVGRLFGAAPHECPEAYYQASPLQRLQEFSSNQLERTSLFLIWGDADQVVPPEQSEHFLWQLKRLGVKHKSLVIPEQGHFWFTILPGRDGGRLTDYPNRMIAPQLIEFLRSEC
jgi:acetyl esterase/lipase